ncbi:T9SS type A sorting domain-containing protein [Flavobacterium sp. IB48]|uniref:T9SS type A sorting domain-containing protein n=1 Tax=Flavobacterium sp. IB48 TaxID=2779375 RepID=UPI0018E8101F|nr:T9SS type A sorting domain-containing protein [Flavobacterium sp. IB48]MBJ2125311.1 T9SS type A sorting domain-containing protein [Flavobacterium sp. IB48]
MKQVLHNPLIILLLLVNFNLYSQVTITTNNLKVDNKPISNNTISFNSNESVYVSLNIHLQTSNSSINNIFGNLFLYYQKNAEDSPTQIGFQSVTFYLNTYYMNDTPFNITLLKGGFFQSGGILYAEYKSNDNKTYQSNKITITGGSLPSSPPVITPTNEAIPTQNLKYSENFPIVNSKIFLAEETPTFIDIEVQSKKEGDHTSIGISLDEMIGNKINKTILLKSIWIDSDNNFHLLKDIQIDPSKLNFTQYTYTLKAKMQHYRTTTNPQLLSSKTDFVSKDNSKVTILLSRPIQYNTISESQSISPGETAKPLIGAVAKISLDKTGLRNTVDITKYQWQQRVSNNNWTNILGATSQNYTPSNIFTETTSFRRIAISNEGLPNFSEYISISTIPAPNNNICCDQNLTYNSSQPSTFTGNDLGNSVLYQWQVSQNSTSWVGIPDSNRQNLNYSFSYTASRGNESAQFRRLIIQNDAIISTSNKINVIRSTSTDPSIPLPPPTEIDAGGRRTSTLTTESNEFDTNKLMIYPNPTTDNVYIDGFVNIELLNLYDSYGAKINIDKNQKSTNLIEINTSKLQPGIYILKIDNTTYSKTIIKN